MLLQYEDTRLNHLQVDPLSFNLATGEQLALLSRVEVVFSTLEMEGLEYDASTSFLISSCLDW